MDLVSPSPSFVCSVKICWKTEIEFKNNCAECAHVLLEDILIFDANSIILHYRRVEEEGLQLFSAVVSAFGTFQGV